MAETVLETLSKKEIIFFGLVLFVGLSAFFVIGGTKGISMKINFYTMMKLILCIANIRHVGCILFPLKYSCRCFFITECPEAPKCKGEHRNF